MKALAKFFLITFAVTWTCGFTALSFSGHSGLLAYFVYPLLMIGTFAPSPVALGLTAHDEGLVAAQTLLRRVFQTTPYTRWYLRRASHWPEALLRQAGITSTCRAREILRLMSMADQ